MDRAAVFPVPLRALEIRNAAIRRGADSGPAACPANTSGGIRTRCPGGQALAEDGCDSMLRIDVWVGEYASIRLGTGLAHSGQIVVPTA